MFKAFVELINNLNQLGKIEELRQKQKDHEKKVKELEDIIDSRNKALTHEQNENFAKSTRDQLKNNLEVERAKNEIRKEMQKSLIESDLLRVEAQAKLQAYEKHNSKDEMEVIKKMLEKAIDGLSKTQAIVNVNKGA